jgi:hypothetical protein
MKSIFRYLPVLALLVSCELLNDSKITSDSVGGDTNLSMNAVNTSFNSYVKIGSNNFNANSSMVVTNNDNGVLTIQVKATLPANLAALLPSNLKDASGKMSTNLKIKNTSEGILDYFNADGKPFVIANYSSNVGDTYTLTKSNGATITRKVTAKTEVDDFPYGMMLIKTMTVEQDSRIPGINKIIYKVNHKYSLVQIQFVMNDGSTITINLV